MSEAANEFRAAIERVCSGSEEAVWEFIEEYGPHIHRVVRRRLQKKLRPKFDSIDFVQMVWASLFADLRQIADKRDPEQLISYLVTMARNKVIEESRRRMALTRYDIGCERPLNESDLTEPQSIKRHDTPSAHLVAKEQLERMMRSRRERRIVQLRLKGATQAQIARVMGLNERTVRKILEEIEEAAHH
jgi:RNA polymerase sigma factor (sigma-70 family)